MPKACPVIYLDLSEKINGYILYDPVKKSIFESSNVVFDEYVFGVLNLLKCIDTGNIPHYFNTYLNEKFIDFLKLSDCDDVLSTNTNPVDCVYENPDDSTEIIIDDYPVDVEKENRIDHSTPAPVNLHSKHTTLNEKTHSMNVYSNDDDDEMVLLSISPPNFTQSNGFYTFTSSSCSSCSSSSFSSSPIVDSVQAAAAPDFEILPQRTKLDMKDEESEGTENNSADENESELPIDLDNYEMFIYPPGDHDPDPYAPADQSASSYFNLKVSKILNISNISVD